MGLFDFLKSDKKKQHEAADKAKEQVEQQGAPSDAASATRAAAERMAAAAPPKPAPAPPRPAPPRPAAPRPAATGPLPHTPTPASAAHKAVPAAPVKPAATAARRTYTVKPGDSLSAIARRELGNEGRWRELYAMNRGVVGDNPDLIRPGMVLTLPS